MAPPTMLNAPEVLDSIIKAVETGVPVTTACRAAGIAAQTVSDWLKAADTGTWPATGTPVSPESLASITDFSERVTRARARHEARMAQAVTDAATIPDTFGKVDWRAGAWYLNNSQHTRKQWKPDRDATITQQGTVSHEHSLAAAMTPAELTADLEAEWQELAAPPPAALPEPEAGGVGRGGAAV